MNIKIKKDRGTISIVLISSLLIVVAITERIEPQEVTSQSATDAFARMGGIGLQNQTREVLSYSRAVQQWF